MAAARLSSRLKCSCAPLESVGRPQTYRKYLGFTQRVDFASKWPSKLFCECVFVNETASVLVEEE